MEIKDIDKDRGLENIPSGWKIKRIDEFADIKIGGTPTRKESKYWENGIHPWVSISDVSKSNKYLFNTKEKITDEGIQHSNVKLIPKNSVLMTFKLTLGKLVITARDVFTNEAIAAILPNNPEQLITDYLYYALNNVDYERLVDTAVKGKTLNKSKLSEIKMLIPPLKEQQKIAEILSTVDEQIEQTDQLIEKTKELKKGLMQQLLIKGIGHTEFKHTELGEIPVEWEVKMLPDLVTSEKNAIKIGPFGSQLKKELLVEYGYKVYGQENIIAKDFNKGSRFLTPEHFNKLKTSELKAGDFVITMMGTIGKCGVFPDNALPGIMDSHLLRIRLNKELYTNELLLHVINSDLVQKQLKNLSVGGIMAGLSSKTVKKILLPVPSIEEQRKIASIITSVDKDIEGYEEEKSKYEELKKGLMQQLLTGKTRVKAD